MTFPHASVPLIESTLRGKQDRLLVWHWYWVAGRYVADPYRAKLMQATAKLAGKGDDGAVVIVYTPYDQQPDAARQVMRDFVDAMLPGVTRVLENARRSGHQS